MGQSMSDQIWFALRMTRHHIRSSHSPRWLSPRQIRARFDQIREIVLASGRPPKPVQAEFNFYGEATFPSRRGAMKRRPRVLVW